VRPWTFTRLGAHEWDASEHIQIRLDAGHGVAVGCVAPDSSSTSCRSHQRPACLAASTFVVHAAHLDLARPGLATLPASWDDA
jgi:hypothetical protein